MNKGEHLPIKRKSGAASLLRRPALFFYLRHASYASSMAASRASR